MWEGRAVTDLPRRSAQQPVGRRRAGAGLTGRRGERGQRSGVSRGILTPRRGRDSGTEAELWCAMLWSAWLAHGEGAPEPGE